MKIPLSNPDIGELEIEYVTRVLRSGRLSLGPRLAEFEEKFAAYVGTQYAVATSSGTSGLHLCVKALGIGAEDEVITTSFSFVASTNCLLYEGALPAFVDIDPATLNLSPDEVRAAIARDYAWNRGQLVNRMSGGVLKAILPVHVFGMPCHMDPILEIAHEFDLRVIEDACEALGATYRGRAVGTLGDVGIFAFYPNKQMTTAEGGMIVTNDRRMAQLCRSLRNQGRDDDATWLRHLHLGYNYRLSELHCALGLAQLERVDELLGARERVARIYSCELAGVRGIALPCGPPGWQGPVPPGPATTKNEGYETRRSWFVYVIRLLGPSASVARHNLMRVLRQRGIACQTYFPAIHQQPYFRGITRLTPCPLPFTESASESCLALPFFSSMTEEQVAEVCATLREVMSRWVLREEDEGNQLTDAATVH